MKPISLSWDADISLPVSLSVVKAHARISHSEFDPLISEIHLPAAIEWAEGEMHRSILAKVHYWVLDSFPVGPIRLPRGKTQSVTSIQYTTGGSTTTLRGPTSGSPIGTDFREDLRGNDGGYLWPASGMSWPATDTDAPTPVLITFTAGWMAAQIPADIKHGMAMYVADAVDIAGAADVMPSTNLSVKDTILSAWRLTRWC